jgi:hypothetical protein
MALCLAMLYVGAAFAGPLGSEGSVGVTAAYTSNPLLLTSGAHAAELLAVVLDTPISYTGGANTWSLSPRVRWGKTRGAIAPLSDYQYLDGMWDQRQERGELAIGADYRRDSTLYNPVEHSALGGYNLHRAEWLGTINWRHEVSERSEFTLDGSFDRVNYAASVVQPLFDFDFRQGMLGLRRKLTEQWDVQVSAGASGYQRRDYKYRVSTPQAQIKLTRPLSDRLSLSLQAGYARLVSRTTLSRLFLEPNPNGGYRIVPRDVELAAAAHTTDYGATLRQTFERWHVDLSAARTLQPSGLGVLLTQDDLAASASRDLSDRLSVAVALRADRTRVAGNGQSTAVSGSTRYYSAEVSISWRWAEGTRLQSQLAVSRQRAAAAAPTLSNVGFFLTATHDLGRHALN